MKLKLPVELKNPYSIFLIDGYGALLSMFLYLALLATYSGFFGMPRLTFISLGLLAALYAVYSFSCYLIKVKNWSSYLRVIAIANLLHCLLTCVLIIYYWRMVTIWGVFYFVGEILIVTALAMYELKLAKENL
ncbi:MAG: hypothetical protein AAGA77_19605 [Bacteroidota bacterium]